jgi:hypothetical protein
MVDGPPPGQGEEKAPEGSGVALEAWQQAGRTRPGFGREVLLHAGRPLAEIPDEAGLEGAKKRDDSLLLTPAGAVKGVVKGVVEWVLAHDVPPERSVRSA